MAQHQADEGFVAFAGRVGERLGIVGQRRIRRENGGRCEDVAAVGEEENRPRRAMGAKELDHLRVRAGVAVAGGGERGAERVRGALHLHVGMRTVGEQQPDDFDVATEDGGVQGVAVRGYAFLREVRIRAALQQ